MTVGSIGSKVVVVVGEIGLRHVEEDRIIMLRSSPSTFMGEVEYGRLCCRVEANDPPLDVNGDVTLVPSGERLIDGGGETLWELQL